MSEQDVASLFKNYKQYQAELSILHDCIDELQEAETEASQERYALLKRRINLVQHWLAYLPKGEAEVVSLHLIDGHSWLFISNLFASQFHGDVPCDERTLQRLQSRGLKRICTFVACGFEHKLDYLIDSTDICPNT